MRNVLAATCLATAFAVAGAGAQTTGQQTGQQQPAQQYGQQDRDRTTVSLTGCVQAGEDAGTFVLAVDRQEYQRAMQQARGTGELAQHDPATPQDPTAQPDAVGTTGAEAMARDKEKVRLTDAPAHINLQDKLNQQVRVTGSIQDADRDRTAAATAGVDHHGTTGTAGTATGTTAERGDRDRDKAKTKLNVQSVQVIAETCPQDAAGIR